MATCMNAFRCLCAVCGQMSRRVFNDETGWGTCRQRVEGRVCGGALTLRRGVQANRRMAKAKAEVERGGEL
jgi:hypothetical protein